MKKEAYSKISGVELIHEEELKCVEVLHRKGKKLSILDRLHGFKEDEDLFRYKDIKDFHSLDELANFIGKVIMVTEDNKIFILPQVRVHEQTGFFTSTISSTAYDSIEEAEAVFNKLVEENNLSVKED